MSFKILIDEIQTNILKIIEELDLPQTSFTVEPTKSNFGDVTCNVPFLLAKHMKKKPYDIAKIFSEKYQPYQGNLVSKVEAHQSGFINFFVNYLELNKIILKASKTGEFGFLDIGLSTWRAAGLKNRTR